jgi:hypothetical protein
MAVLTVEIPDAVLEAMQRYQENRPEFDASRIAIASLCLFLFQNDVGGSIKSQQLSRLYLDCLFKKELTHV